MHTFSLDVRCWIQLRGGLHRLPSKVGSSSCGTIFIEILFLHDIILMVVCILWRMIWFYRPPGVAILGHWFIDISTRLRYNIAYGTSSACDRKKLLPPVTKDEMEVFNKMINDNIIQKIHGHEYLEHVSWVGMAVVRHLGLYPYQREWNSVGSLDWQLSQQLWWKLDL